MCSDPDDYLYSNDLIENRLAKNLQKIVRSHNAVPATIALLDGKVHVGLNEQQLHRVADDFDSIKVSKRDIPYALVNVCL